VTDDNSEATSVDADNEAEADETPAEEHTEWPQLPHFLNSTSLWRASPYRALDEAFDL